MHPNFKEALDNELLKIAERNGRPFEHEGQVYYQATGDGANMSVKRWHALTDIIARHDKLKLSDEVLRTEHAIIKDLAKQCLREMLRGDGQEPNTSPATEIEICVARLEQRQHLGMDTAMLLEMASVWYVREDEDAYDYDPAKGRQKMEAWSRDAGLFGFFLSLPLGNIVPLRGLLNGDTLSALKAINEYEILDLTRMLLLSESLGITPATRTTIESRRETLFGLHGWDDAALKNTTNT